MNPLTLQRRIETFEVIADDGPNIGVERDRVGPFVFPPLARDFMTGTNRHAGKFLAQQFGALLLVGGVRITVKKDDRDRSDVLRATFLGAARDVFLVQRLQDLARGAHALPYLEPKMTRHEGRGGPGP
jgi:hypothetical protein